MELLEISSPGLERALRWPEHWRRFVGSRVRVRSSALRGQPMAWIVAVPDDAHVTLRLQGTEAELTIALEDIREATLVVDWSKIR